MTTATNTVSDTATLQMVRAEVNVRDFQRWMGTRRLQDQDHAMHCLLTECFGSPPTKENPENTGLAPRLFRMIIPRGGSTGCLYGYGRPMRTHCGNRRPSAPTRCRPESSQP